jgi:MFS family permease
VTATAPPDRLQRDAITWWAYGAFAAFAYVLNGLAAVLLAVREDLDLSRTVQGLHSTAVAVGLVAGGLVADRLRARVGWMGMFRISAFGQAVAAVALATAGTVAGTLPAALLLGFSGSLLVVLVPIVLSARHGRHTAAALTEVNAVASLSGIVAPLAVGASIAVTGEWSLAYLLPMAVALPVLDLQARRLRLRDEAPAAPRIQGRLPGSYWRWWTVILLAVAVEFTMLLWASDDAHGRLGLSDAAAATAPSAFLIGMAAARALGGRLALRIPAVTLFRLALVASALGFAVFRASDAVAPAFAGLVLTGAGTGLLYPLALATAIELATGRESLASARAVLASGAAIGAGPLALGGIADATGTGIAFLVVPVLLLAAGLASWDRRIA